MTPTDQNRPEEKLIHVLKAAHHLDLEDAPRKHSQQTPQCPSLARFAVARVQGWTNAEKQHILEERCAYCQKVLAMFERIPCEEASPKSPPALNGPTSEDGSLPNLPDTIPTESHGSVTETRSTGFTAMVRAGHVSDLEERLRPWLPFLLQWAGLPEDRITDLTQQFLAYIHAHLQEVQHRRFRDLLPEWLYDFARKQHLTHRLRTDLLQPTADEFEAAAIARVLGHACQGEATWATTFRESALRSDLLTAERLLAFEPVELKGVRALPTFRRDLYREARRIHLDGLELFECERSA